MKLNGNLQPNAAFTFPPLTPPDDKALEEDEYEWPPTKRRRIERESTADVFTDIQKDIEDITPALLSTLEPPDCPPAIVVHSPCSEGPYDPGLDTITPNWKLGGGSLEDNLKVFASIEVENEEIEVCEVFEELSTPDTEVCFGMVSCTNCV